MLCHQRLTGILAVLFTAIPLPDSARAESAAPPLEPIVAGVASRAVALEVSRDEEPPNLSGLNVRSSARLPPETIAYRSRPAGPATGLLLDGEANVLTSYYNVAGNVHSVAVVFPGGARRPARVVAVDKSDDLALVRTLERPPGLEVPPPRWADPEALRVGKVVIVLGRSPDPDSPTVTYGIISAVGRNGGRAFQTDAKLNYGNVGGPIALLNGSIAGVAGFVGHTYALWGLNSGIGFGTRADTIRAVLPTLLKGEDISPPELPFLGVGESNLPGPGNVGARIGEVQRGSAADRAGLKVNDVVLSFNGEKVEDFLDLRHRINQHHPGDEVVLKVKREDQDLELKVRLGKRPE